MSSAAPLQTQSAQSTGHSSVNPAAGFGMLQRKCACGGSSATMSGTCEECKKKRLGVQAKLSLGAPGDAYEQEADRIADQVMQGGDHPAARPAPVRVQRLAAGPAAGSAESVPDSVGRTLAGSGQVLDTAPRALMERQFGRAFGTVRVHTDATAAQSAAEIGARAYTHGRDIVFAAGEYQPGSAVGRRLLAHELTHVVQQSGDVGAPVQRDLAIKPVGVNQKERPLSEQDIKAAIDFNAKQIKNKDTLRTVRDVVGVSPEPVVSDRDLALGVARWQAAHGVAQDGRLEPMTVTLIVEELQAEGDLVPSLGAKADALKGAFAKGAVVDIDASHCGCKPELEDEIKSADFMIAEYTACGADPTNKTGDDIEDCVKARAKAQGRKLTLLGSTSQSGAISMTGKRKGPCAAVMNSIDHAHERIHSVHTGELQQQFGKGSAAFKKAFNDAPDWVADEINSRNTDKSLATWALSVLKRTCP